MVQILQQSNGITSRVHVLETGEDVETEKQTINVSFEIKRQDI